MKGRNSVTIVFVEANSTGTTSAALRLARTHGYKTAFVTADREFYSQVPNNPLKLADRVLDANTYDPLAVLRAIRSLDVEAIISFDDYHLSTSAVCARDLGLPHADLHGLLATRFKDVMRERTRRSAGAVAFHTIEPGMPPQTHLQYPVVLKPVDESGSVAVRRCDSAAELVDAVDAFAPQVVNARGYRSSRSLLVEEYLTGPEYSCELMWKPDTQEWVVCGFTRKILGAEPHFVEVGHIFPAGLDPATVKETVRRVAEWLSAVDLRCNAAHVEFRLTSTGPRLIEINPRLPGGHITDLVQWCTGIDMVGAYLSIHLREGSKRFGDEPGPPVATMAATRHLMASELVEPGTLVALRGAKLGTLRHFEAKQARAGSSTAVDTTNYDRLGYLLFAAADPAAVLADLDTASEILRPCALRLIAGSTK
jgi:hypothetical protein